MKYILNKLRIILSCKGRVRRINYFVNIFLAIILLMIGVSFWLLMASALDEDSNNYLVMGLGCISGGIGFILILISLMWLIANRVKRFHDINCSGWWILIGLIPYVGGIVLFIMSLIEGTYGPNKYGPDPKGRKGPNDIEREKLLYKEYKKVYSEYDKLNEENKALKEILEKTKAKNNTDSIHPSTNNHIKNQEVFDETEDDLI